MDVKNYNEMCRGWGGFKLNLYLSCCCVTVISLFSTMFTVSNNYLPSVFVGHEVYKQTPCVSLGVLNPSLCIKEFFCKARCQ